MNDAEVETYQDAILFAQDKHKGQFRKSTVGEMDYVIHCIEVSEILIKHGIDDVDILVAGVLHDIIEDTDVRADEIEEMWNLRTAELVLECTTDLPGMTVKQKRERLKRKCPTWSFGARCIKTADGLSNIKSIVELLPDWHVHTQRGFTDTCVSSVNMIHRDAGPKPPNSLMQAFFDQARETYTHIEGLEELRKIRKAEEKTRNIRNQGSRKA